jgi:arginase/N-omega-hydroxy-L-arginine amidinohydrolase
VGAERIGRIGRIEHIEHTEHNEEGESMPHTSEPERSFALIISQGRVADRTDGALRGARAAGEALGEYLERTPVVVGAPSPSADDDWSNALPAARATLEGLRDAVAAALDAGEIPLLVTNTCAASLGTLPTVAVRHPDAVVLWIDAHGDFNTPDTTGSGYLGGMVLAAACGLWDSGHGAGIDPRRVIVVGGRDIDPAEGELLAASGAIVLPPAESTAARVAELVAGREVWIHVDWDVLEPGYIPAAYRVPDGLRPHQIADIFAVLRDQVRGVELAEFEYGDAEIPSAVSVEMILETFQALTR